MPKNVGEGLGVGVGGAGAGVGEVPVGGPVTVPPSLPPPPHPDSSAIAATMPVRITFMSSPPILVHVRPKPEHWQQLTDVTVG